MTTHCRQSISLSAYLPMAITPQCVDQGINLATGKSMARHE
jgi:hypothetical protein